MRKLYYLSTCSTCSKILKELELPSDYDLQDIKTDPLTADQLTDLHKRAGSYENLFSKRAQLYKQRGLKDKNLTEYDYKELLLEHYTFLKRPVLVVDNQIFIGNASKTIVEAKKAIHE
ncbi:MAG: ArsC/Spx/MgsR family protein [Flavobacteriaceae bacterium]